jgi:hypothetical protein
MLLPLLCRIKSDFLEEAMIFQEKLLPKLAKFSEMTV